MIIRRYVLANIAGNPGLDLAGTTSSGQLALRQQRRHRQCRPSPPDQRRAAGSSWCTTPWPPTVRSQPCSPHGHLFVTDTIVAGYGVAITGTGATSFNLFFNNGPWPPASGGHSLVANPLFVNPAGGDFHLSAGSPAINAGIGAGQTGDFDGDLRPIGAGFDIGFDEFLSELFLPLVLR
jgi:hypothetical protein